MVVLIPAGAMNIPPARIGMPGAICEPALCGPLAIPLVVAGEIDVFPAEWREVFEKLRVDGLAAAGPRKLLCR